MLGRQYNLLPSASQTSFTLFPNFFLLLCYSYLLCMGGTVLRSMLSSMHLRVVLLNTLVRLSYFFDIFSPVFMVFLIWSSNHRLRTQPLPANTWSSVTYLSWMDNSISFQWSYCHRKRNLITPTFNSHRPWIFLYFPLCPQDNYTSILRHELIGYHSKYSSVVSLEHFLSLVYILLVIPCACYCSSSLPMPI